MSIDESTLQSKGRDLVAQEVHLCLSSLVYTLATGYGDARGDIGELAEQAFELSSPIPDFEEAAREVGWEPDDSGATTQNVYRDKTDGQTWCAADWETLCRDHDIEPYDREVYEHWAVSSWLADKLEARGERVDRDFAGLIVWARTTTGQAILLDGVIRDIVRELHNLQEEG